MILGYRAAMKLQQIRHTAQNTPKEIGSSMKSTTTETVILEKKAEK